MAIGTELDFIVPDERLDGETIAARILPATFITLSGSEIGSDAQIGDAVGTLAIASAYQGTPVWELIDSADGRFAVNPSTGVVTVAGSLSAGSTSIKAKARGIRPQIFSPTFVIVITDAGGGLPAPPTGFHYIVNADGKYLVNADGAYILADGA